MRTIAHVLPFSLKEISKQINQPQYSPSPKKRKKTLPHKKPPTNKHTHTQNNSKNSKPTNQTNQKTPKKPQKKKNKQKNKTETKFPPPQKSRKPCPIYQGLYYQKAVMAVLARSFALQLLKFISSLENSSPSVLT